MESKKAMLASRIVYIFLTFILLFVGLGLLGVVLANLVAPFVNRYLSYNYFFIPELSEKLKDCHATREEQIRLFKIIWFNAKKFGLVIVGSYAINKLGLFLAGLYLSLTEIASYGLMIQLMSVISMASTTLFGISMPQFSALRVEGKREKLLKNFSFTMNIYYTLFFLGCIFLILLAPYLLKIIHSNVELPSISLLVLYSIILLLENNHSNFASFIITDNTVPFVESSLIAGVIIALGSYFSLRYTTLGILGLILVQGLCQLAYANWKWPYVVCREFKISFPHFLRLGMEETIYKLKLYYYGK
jgi:O-antigen/teichoic acid export membrane protein